MRIGKILRYTVFLWLFCWQASAQNAPPSQNPDLLSAAFLPKSPTVSSLGRFDALQHVDLKSGAAQLAIPLTQVTSGALQVSVSLSYTYSGLKVYQPRDLIGLGWALQAGGSITRQINGLPDDQSTGYGRYDSTLVWGEINNQTFLKNALNQDVDTAPDMYSYSIDGYSGRFTLQQGKVTLLPSQPIRIEVLPNGNFQLSAESGIRYLFDAQEFTKPNPNNFGRIGQHISSWQVTRIISAGSTDTIRLHYTKHSYRDPLRCVSTTGRYFPGWENGGFQIACQVTEPYTWHNIAPIPSLITAQYLDSITTRGARICLTRSRASDSLHQVQQVRLFSVSRRGRECVKAFTLQQSYFTSGSVTDRWLRLDGLQEWNGEEKLPAYRFQYEEGELPARTSTAQDYWGYYNGQLRNFTGINSDLYPALLSDPLIDVLGFQPARRMAANRYPDWEFAKRGALRRVIYPTGGITSFEYEGNRYGFDSEVTRKVEEVLEVTQGHPEEQMVRNPNDIYDQIGRFPCNSTMITIDPDKVRSFDVVRMRISFGRRASSDEGIAKNKSHDLEVFKVSARGDSLIKIGRGGQRDNDTTSVVLNVSAGTYKVRLFAELPDEENIAIIRLAYQELERDKVGPGIRVRQTTTTAIGSPALVKTYDYTITDPTGTHSSGVTLLPLTQRGYPQFEDRTFLVARWDGPNIAQCVFGNTSSDNTGEGNEHSKYTFFYQCVTERTAGQSNSAGATASYFQVIPEQFNEVVLQKRLTYRWLPDAHLPASRRLQLAERMTYHYAISDRISYPMIKVWQNGQSIQNMSGGPLFYGPLETYAAHGYRFYAAFSVPDRVQQARYSESGDSVETVQLSTYQKQRLVRAASHVNGKWQINRYKYLHEYNPSLPGMQALRSHNFNPIIETQVWQRSLGKVDSVLTAGQITRYHPQWQKPDSSWSLPVGKPLAALNAERRLDGFYTAFRSDSRYQLQATITYDPARGQVQQVQPAHGRPTAYVWGYNHTQPTAEVKNASFQQIGYTSFELGELSTWQGTGTFRTEGYTGLSSYRLGGGSLSTPALPAGEYLLSCWLKVGDGVPSVNGQILTPASSTYQGWQLHQRTLTISQGGAVTLTGIGQLDELRIHPVGAQMTTYTHRLLVGETSQTGPDGRTAYYEYDQVGRLLRVRNEKGEILTQQQYHYARP